MKGFELEEKWSVYRQGNNRACKNVRDQFWTINFTDTKYLRSILYQGTDPDQDDF